MPLLYFTLLQLTCVLVAFAVPNDINYLQSPQILQLSGVGPASLLNKQGVEVVHNAKGVADVC